MSYLTPFLHGGLWYIGIFLVVLTVLVFVHELGHYLIARRNGVRIDFVHLRAYLLSAVIAVLKDAGIAEKDIQRQIGLFSVPF